MNEGRNPPSLDPDEGPRPLQIHLGVLCCLACCAGLVWYIGQIDQLCADRRWGCLRSQADFGLFVLGMLFCLGIFAGYAVARPQLEWGMDLVLAAGFWLGATLIILTSDDPLRILIVLILGAALVSLVLRQDREAPDDTGFIRGSRLMTAAGYTRLLLRQLGGHPERAAARLAIASGDRSGGVWIAGAPLPPGNESLHILITACTRAGKSVTLRALLDNIRARGERAFSRACSARPSAGRRAIPRVPRRAKMASAAALAPARPGARPGSCCRPRSSRCPTWKASSSRPGPGPWSGSRPSYRTAKASYPKSRGT